MTNTLAHFIAMNGHGSYVWSAYGVVFALLAVQWFLDWRRWKNHLRNQQTS